MADCDQTKPITVICTTNPSRYEYVTKSLMESALLEQQIVSNIRPDATHDRNGKPLKHWKRN